MRFAITLSWMLLVTATVLADRATDVAHIHLEAMGGRERISALMAVRMTGEVVAGGKQVRFKMVAARPNRVRLETESGGRTLVQGTDGTEPAWEFDTGTSPAAHRPMAAGVAKTFVADAEFDDPLIAAADRGYTFDFAGEVEVEDRKLFRLLVTHNLTETFSLLLDVRSYLIVMRVEERSNAMGRKVRVVTRYEDFRPVGGVLLAHDVTTAIDGRVTQQMKIARTEANPVLSPDTFTGRGAVVPGAGAR